MEIFLVEKMALLLASSIPLSIILAKQISRIFSKFDSTLEKTTTIVTDVVGILVKKEMEIKYLYFNNFKAQENQKTNSIEMENLKTKEFSTVEKSFLKSEKSFEYAAIAGYLCRYQKLDGLENVINSFFTKCGFAKNFLREEYDKIQELPTSEIKKISTTIAIRNINKEIFAFSKGNPRSLLKNCKRILLDGQKAELTYNMRLAIKKRIKRLNQNGQKVIAFAYKGLPIKRLSHYSEEFAENDLIFLGMISLSNAVNTEIKEQMQLVRKLGIKTYILSTTKEKQTTGAAVELEVINPTYFETINSDYLKDLPDQKLSKMLENKEKDYIFTELKQEDSARITKLLKETGDKVTIINPEKKITFQKIMQAIKKYRTDKENEPKLITHAISCKIAEIFIILSAIILRMPLPLSITLILFIEIFINLPLELAMKGSSPEKDVMDKEYIFPKKSIPALPLLLNGLIIGFIVIGIYIFNLSRYGWTIGNSTFINDEVVIRSITMGFILLISGQIFNAYNVNDLNKTIFKKANISNKYLLATTIIVIMATYTIINFFILKKYFDITIISIVEWQIMGFAILIMILAEETKKYLLKYFQKNAD